MMFEDNTFTDAFSKAFVDTNESVLDFAGGSGLNPDIWSEKDGEYSLRKEVYEKARVIADWAIDKFDLKKPDVVIVGSICSNSYNDKSDIDIHISDPSFDEDNSMELNGKLMSAFKKKFVGTKNGEFKGHPFEVYFQHNPHQDEMSVGCYELESGKWLSGPEILPKDFNPYAEYYDGIRKHMTSLVPEMREHVLKCGETASIVLKLVDELKPNDKFMERMESELRDNAKKARELFMDIRKKRSIASAPKSRSEALRKRDSMEWKVADASFKLMDKLGYIATMLSIAKAGEEDGISTKRLAEKTAAAIRDNLFNKDRTGYADIDKD